MMDALDRLRVPAANLLSRVDTLLTTAGAPAGHPVLPLLLRLRTLPGEAVGAFTAFTASPPGPLAAVGTTLHQIQRRYAESHRLVDTSTSVEEWRGPAADAFAARWAALVGFLCGDMTDRLSATVSYVDELSGWLVDARHALARTVAEVLVCAEAVRVCAAVTTPGPDPRVARAAADIAVRILAACADIHATGESLLARWRPRLTEATFVPPAPPTQEPEPIMRIPR